MWNFERAFPRSCALAFVAQYILILLTPVVNPASAQEASTPQAAVGKVCTACHGLEIVMDTPKTYDAWHDTIQKMIDHGAQGTSDEFDLVMQYLYENMTTVDVNHADSDTLATVLSADPSTVSAIIARREKHPFKSLTELEASNPILDHNFLETKKRMIFFQ